MGEARDNRFQVAESDFLHLAKNMERILRCLKCQRSLEPPIQQCVKGHVVCHRCREFACPSCSGGFVSAPRLLEQLFELVPRPCRYKNRGCGDVSVSGRHEAVCGYRVIECRVGQAHCGWTGTVLEWRDHVTSKHATNRVVYNRNNFEKTGSAAYHFHGMWSKDCMVHEVGKKTFLFFMTKIGDQLNFAVRYVPLTSDNKCLYYIKVNCYEMTSSACKHSYFLFAAKAKVLQEKESLKSSSKFHGVLLKDVLHRRTKMEFQLIKVNE